MSNEIINDATERMEKSFNLLKDQYLGIGYGGISGILDSLKVEYYGSQTPLIQLAVIMSHQRGRYTIRPHDPTTIKEIERTIHKANLGVSVMSDKAGIHVTAPSPSMEQRKKLAEHAVHMANEFKVAIRKIRQDARTKLKKAKFSEDDEKKADRDLQGYTDEYCDMIDELCESKQASILEV